jgi:hypothetical protein
MLFPFCEVRQGDNLRSLRILRKAQARPEVGSQEARLSVSVCLEHIGASPQPSALLGRELVPGEIFEFLGGEELAASVHAVWRLGCPGSALEGGE